MKKIAISGAGGFLGTELVRELINNDDFKVLALTTQAERMNTLFGEFHNFETVSVIPNDVDLLINCAFPANANGVRLAEGLKYISNLYKEAVACRVKSVIHISSQSVYSQTKNQPASETTPCDLNSKYAVGKFSVEGMTNIAFSGIPHTNLRMASLVGIHADTRIVNRLIKQVMDGKDIHVVADRQEFGFLDVRDAVSALAKLVCSDSSKWDEVYNLGRNEGYSLQNIAKLIVEIGKDFGYHSAVVMEPPIQDVRDSTLNAARLMEFLGWHPEITLDQTIRDTFNHYQMNRSNGK